MLTRERPARLVRRGWRRPEQPGHELVVSVPHGDAAAGELGREETGPGERLESDDVVPSVEEVVAETEARVAGKCGAGWSSLLPDYID